jgi:hypothetical protein
MAIKALRPILALVLALTLALGALLARPESAAAQHVGVSGAGACSYAANWCGVTVYGENGAIGVTATLYGYNGGCACYYTQSVNVYPSPGQPKAAWFWVRWNDRVDAITLASSGWITGYYGPYVGW